MDKSISIIVPCFNEEKNLPLAISDILSSMKRYGSGFEIVIVDDGSTDGTGIVADKLARRQKTIRVIHHSQNLGFGRTFRSGIAAAKKTWLVPFHGDNDSSASSLRAMIDRIGEADVISAYTVNTQVRSLPRRVVSRSFVLFVNLLFGFHMRYYTGYFICRTATLQRLPLQSGGLAIYAEAKVRLLKKGASIIEVPFVHTGRKYGKSTAVGLKSIRETLETLWVLVRDIF